MSDQDSKPTPAIGIPAVSAVTMTSIEAQSPTSMSAVTNDKLLTTIEEVRDEARERGKKDDERFHRIEMLQDQHATSLSDLAAETRSNTKNIGEQADALTRIAVAAARAGDIALDAKRQAANASDETTKIVQSALAMHGTSITASVDQAVTRAVTPLVTKVDSLEKSKEDTAATLTKQNDSLADLKRNDEATAKTLENQDSTLKEHGVMIGGVQADVSTVVTNVGAIASGVAKLVRWQDQWWVKVLLGLAAAAGVAYAGYRSGVKNEPQQQPSTQTVIVSPAQAPSLTAPTPSY